MVMATAVIPEFAEYAFEKIGYDPTQGGQNVYQPRILACDKRFVLISGGDRGGKSLTGEKLAFLRTWNLEDDETGLYWLVAADYNRTRAAFDYLVEDYTRIFGPKAVNASKRVDPGWIQVKFEGDRKPMLRFETKSAKDPRTLVMHAPHGILVDEASQVDLDTFERLRIRLAEKRGWLILTGTMEGSLGWFPGMIKAWELGIGDAQSFRLPMYSNRVLFPGGIDDPEIQRLKRESPDRVWMERVEGEPVPPRGLVFDEFRADIHVQDISYVPGVPVTITIDPGYAGANCVLAIQEINGVVQVFDEIYENMITTDMVHLIRGKPWLKNVDTAVIDHAGWQHQAMTPPARIWAAQPPVGIGLMPLSEPVQNVNDLDDRLKWALKPDPVPKIVFAPGCKGVLSEFGVCENPLDGQTKVYSWKEDRDGNIVGDKPDNRNNHGIRAVEYYLIRKYGYARATSASRQLMMKRW